MQLHVTGFSAATNLVFAIASPSRAAQQGMRGYSGKRSSSGGVD